MATINNGSLKLDGKTLHLLGFRGYIGGSGTYWIGFGEVIDAIQSRPISQEIQDLINEDIQHGQFDNIDHILVTVEVAYQLYFAKIIAGKHIKKAEVDDDRIIFPGVSLPTKNGLKHFKVVVKDIDDPIMATVDVDGKII